VKTKRALSEKMQFAPLGQKGESMAKYYYVKLHISDILLAVLPWEIGEIPVPLREFVKWKELQEKLGQFHVLNTQDPDIYVLSPLPFRAYYKTDIGIFVVESGEIELDKCLSEFIEVPFKEDTRPATHERGERCYE